ncbi:DUF2063 domain-containing protein [Providencia burhodogranariea]|uniref:Putative DNA-binding domain-containing protein n=1 Tax=Providencia burhodogranariea DSM 19968 TaxID=1141662 RepID=K8WDD7_9GAMM|nr:DUF2063 domain-containing protein [Providencia burhodogranariea]EKT55457.1 hypothetical protein OOA_16739 [Providencia burhodogranariea DSM 19968]
MIIAHSVPALLAAAEEEFSILLRSPNASDEKLPRGISLYRKIVRENITGVLKSVFPLFSQRLKEEDINEIVDMFLYRHQANQPEFHQIATELLLFMRQQCQLSVHELALIEYEWLMYAVEIDDSKVPIPQKISLGNREIPDIEIVLNPTLKIVVLPFSLPLTEETNDKESSFTHYFALYRKYDNAIWQKKLSEIEVYLLSKMTHEVISAVSLMLFTQEISFQSWLEANNNDEIFSIIFKS